MRCFGAQLAKAPDRRGIDHRHEIVALLDQRPSQQLRGDIGVSDAGTVIAVSPSARTFFSGLPSSDATLSKSPNLYEN